MSSAGTGLVSRNVPGWASTQTPPAPWISASASSGCSACFSTYALPPDPISSSENASFTVGTTPASTRAWATWGRTMFPPSAMARTRSNVIG